MKKILYLFIFLFVITTSAYCAGAHYLERALDSSGKASRWAKMPISVYVQKSPYSPEVYNAFKTWQNSLGGLVSFTHASTPQAAQIVVTFANNLPQNTAGLTSNTKNRNSEIQSSQIRLLAPEYRPELNNYMYSVALHEVGHALGINGHSSDPNDALYPQTTSFNKRQTLSSRDIETVKWLYKVDEATLNKHSGYIANSKLAEAQAYVKKYPTSTVGWSNLGGVYLQLKQYQKAESAYKRALQINPNAYAVHRNLAVLYAQQNRTKEGFDSANTAYRLNPNSLEYLEFLSKFTYNKPSKLTVRNYAYAYMKKYPQSAQTKEMEKIKKSTH